MARQANHRHEDEDVYEAVYTFEDEMLLNRICEELENEGYAVAPVVVPAEAVGAPHRRDRIWIVAYGENAGAIGWERVKTDDAGSGGGGSNFSGTGDWIDGSRDALAGRGDRRDHWRRNWLDVALEHCLRDPFNGFPPGLGDPERNTIKRAIKYFGREEVERRTGLDLRYVEADIYRTDGLKALGNSIVVQVAYELFRAIRIAEGETVEDGEWPEMGEAGSAEMLPTDNARGRASDGGTDRDGANTIKLLPTPQARDGDRGATPGTKPRDNLTHLMYHGRTKSQVYFVQTIHADEQNSANADSPAGVKRTSSEPGKA